MSKITLNNLTDLQNEVSAVANINANNATLQTAMDNTLSRDGTSPNQMGAALDMNSNRIINLPSAGGPGDPVRYAEFASAITGNVGIPTSSPGLVTVSDGGTFVFRQVVAPAAGITVTNPTGGAGNPTLGLSNDLAAVEGLSAVGVIRRTGADTWEATQGTNGQLLLGQTSAAPSFQTMGGDASINNSGTVTLANNAVTSAKILDNNVTTSKILDANVTLAKIQSASATQKILGRNTAGSGPFEEVTQTQSLDWIGNTRGNVLYRGAANWTALPVGTNTQFLKSGGAGADPAWTSAVTSVATDSSMYGGPVTSSGTVGIQTPVFQGRLSLFSATPVMVSNAASGTIIYYTPYNGKYVSIYDGTRFVACDIGTEISTTNVDSTKNPAAMVLNTIYDIFAWNDSGTIRICHGPAWTSSSVGTSTRGAGVGTSELTMVLGVLVNAQNITNGPAANRGTYLGTIRTDGSAQMNFIFGGSSSGGTAAALHVWNMYNRVPITTTVVDTAAGYTYTVSTVRQANASAGNQVNFTVGGQFGKQEEPVIASYSARVTTVAAASGTAAFGVQIDGSGSMFGQRNIISGIAASTMIGASTNTQYFTTSAVGIGTHFIAAVESSDGSNAHTFNSGLTNSLNVQLRM